MPPEQLCGAGEDAVGLAVNAVVERLREQRLAPPPTWPARLLADAERSRTGLADAQQLVARLADSTASGDGDAATDDALDDTMGGDMEDAAETLRAATDARNTARAAHVRTLRQVELEANRRQTSTRLDQVQECTRRTHA